MNRLPADASLEVTAIDNVGLAASAACVNTAGDANACDGLSGGGGGGGGGGNGGGGKGGGPKKK